MEDKGHGSEGNGDRAMELSPSSEGPSLSSVLAEERKSVEDVGEVQMAGIEFSSVELN